MRQRWREELERFKREVSLIAYAASLGYAVDRRESSRRSVVMRRDRDDDKIIVGTDSDGHGVFFSVRDDASGTIIDFVQRRLGCNLGRVRQELRPWLREEARVRVTVPVARPEPASRDALRVIAHWSRMGPYRGQYLRDRGILDRLVQDARFGPVIRQDHRGNAVFPHLDSDGTVCGYELKNQCFTGFARGGRKTAWYSANLGAARRVIVVESAIDALSHAQLLRTGDEAAYVSVGGSMSQAQRDIVRGIVREAQERGAVVVSGVDADAGGDALHAQLVEMGVTERERPDEGAAGVTDWNDLLRRDGGLVRRPT